MRACVSHSLEAQGGKENFGKGKGRKRYRKEGWRAVWDWFLKYYFVVNQSRGTFGKMSAPRGTKSLYDTLSTSTVSCMTTGSRFM